MFGLSPEATTALFVGGFAFLGLFPPMITVWLQSILRRGDKAQDWARLDDVARQAKEAARLLEINNYKVAKTAADTTKRLIDIHTLVNSNLTSMMQENLDSTVRELASLRALASLNAKMGDEPSVETMSAINAAMTKIAELSTTLEDRRKQV